MNSGKIKLKGLMILTNMLKILNTAGFGNVNDKKLLKILWIIGLLNVFSRWFLPWSIKFNNPKRD